jgi:hypothetical protein
MAKHFSVPRLTGVSCRALPTHSDHKGRWWRRIGVPASKGPTRENRRQQYSFRTAAIATGSANFQTLDIFELQTPGTEVWRRSTRGVALVAQAFMFPLLTTDESEERFSVHDYPFSAIARMHERRQPFAVSASLASRTRRKVLPG